MKNLASKWVLITVALFFILISPGFLTDGMFLDGIIYAVLSRNLATGIGSFESLKFSETLFSTFREHPPLVFGIQSLFFKLGLGLYAERIYSVFTYLVSSVIIVLIWKRISITKTTASALIPLFMWLLVPGTAWGAMNNVLENTMTVFVLLALFFYIKGNTGNNALYLILVGLLVFLAFLSKGPTGLFPLAIPFWFFIFRLKTSFSAFFNQTLWLLLGFELAFVLLYFLYNELFQSLIVYLNRQVLGSIETVQTVTNRAYIIKSLLQEISIIAIITIVFYSLSGKIKLSAATALSNKKIAFVLMGIGLSGVVPIMISLKQSGFYILAAIPFFVLGFAVLTEMYWLKLGEIVDNHRFARKGFTLLAIVLTLAAVGLNFWKAGKIGRDKQALESINEICAIVPAHSIVSITKTDEAQWSMYAYFQRKGFISLDADLRKKHKFLVSSEQLNSADTALYNKVNLTNNYYKLYVLK